MQVVYAWSAAIDRWTHLNRGYAAICYIAILLCVIFLLEKRDKRRQPEHSTDAGQSVSEPEEAIGAINACKHPSKAEHRSKEQEHWVWQKELEYSRDKFTRITIVLPSFIVLATELTYCQTRRQADIAQSQLDESRSPAADRPFVFVKPGIANPQEWRMGLAPFQWPYVFINYGKTPAIIKKVQVIASITDLTPPFPSESYSTMKERGVILPPHVTTRPENITPGFAIGAGNTSTDFRADGDQSPLLMIGMPDDIIAKRQRLYMETTAVGRVKFWLIGRVEYENVRHKPFSTNFCFTMGADRENMSEAGGAPCNERDQDDPPFFQHGG